MSNSQQLDDLANLSDDELSKLNLDDLYEDKPDDVTGDGSNQAEPTDEAVASTEETSTDGEQVQEQEQSEEIDYKAFYDSIHAPFKANGRDMQIRSVDEAIELMQKGANYHKKMNDLKPKTRVLKMLEKNGLLDEERLAYLIDLNQKNPEAIAKLVRDADIDAFDLEDKVNPNYKPQVPVVSDVEVELDNILDELKDSPSYARTIDIAGNQWDNQSRQEIASNPQLLRGLNEHVYLGIYDVIATETERLRMLGRLEGMTDLQAYKAVGDHLNAQGAFNYLNPQPTQGQEQQPETVQLNDRRRAAATPSGVNHKDTQVGVNPLTMSDEELLKFVGNLR